MKKYHTFIKSAVGIAVVFGLFKIMIIPVKVDGNSMLGTLHDGDIALLNRWSVSKKSIQRFDVVVIKSKALNENIVKRVIGLPGETIEYKEDHLYVNGKYVKEDNKNTKRAIFLDPGHGGSDSGAVSNGLREKDLTLSVYNKVSSRLASLGYSVLTSRNTDKGVGLVDRADQANKSNADMFLSIHFNAGGRGASYGIETYYYKARPEYTPAINKDKHNDPERLEKSRKLAQKIQQSLVSKTGAFDRGVKRETFAVLRETSIPSILVELGFIDNQEEANKIKTNEYQEKLADGIVDGIVAYYK